MNIVPVLFGDLLHMRSPCSRVGDFLGFSNVCFIVLDRTKGRTDGGIPEGKRLDVWMFHFLVLKQKC